MPPAPPEGGEPPPSVAPRTFDAYASQWTPRAVFLVGVLLGIVALGLGLLALLAGLEMSGAIPSDRPGLPAGRDAPGVSDFLIAAVLAVALTAGARLCFASAREGHRNGRRLPPLSARGQLLLACAVTAFVAVMAVAAAEEGRWWLLPLYVFNPAVLIPWMAVARKRRQERG